MIASARFESGFTSPGTGAGVNDAWVGSRCRAKLAQRRGYNTARRS
jgi:hypothetical protein